MPVADSEIVFGPYTEYTGLRFAFFLLSEYAGHRPHVAALRRALPRRLARTLGDSVGWVWTLLKGFAIAVVIVWLRVAWPRLREDQLQRLAWVWLVPLAIAQIASPASAWW